VALGHYVGVFGAAKPALATAEVVALKRLRAQCLRLLDRVNSRADLWPVLGPAIGARSMTFEEFVRAQLGPLLGLATAMSGDPGLGEDLVQEVLLKAHRHWNKIDKLSSPPSYVRRMLVNEFVSWRRKWSRIVPTADVQLVDDRPDHASTHADHQALQTQLAGLPRRQRAALALRYFGGLSDTEIAEALGCEVTTVRAYISRGLAALRLQPESLLTNDLLTD
jgi:RNA polymerase sigma-70 factor (sigma-E family)